MIWSSYSVSPSQNSDAHVSMFSKTPDVHDFWAQGPWGPWDPPFVHCLKISFMVWDLSRSVSEVFRTPGNPLIK